MENTANQLTAASISFAQIKALRAEALAVDDYDMAAICDLASAGEIDPDDYTTLSPKAASKLRTMTREQAYTECAAAITSAQAQA